MKYCTLCGSEYQDEVTACADDGSTQFATQEEVQRRGLPAGAQRDTRRFVRAGMAEDPLSSERFTQVLEAHHIPVFARPRSSGTVDSITDGIVAPWWEILVPEEHLAKASELIEAAKKEIDSEAEEAGRAAELEATAGPGEES